MPRIDLESALRSLFAVQFDAVGLWQLAQHGIGERRIRREVATLRLGRPCRGVVTGSTHYHARQAFMVAWLAVRRRGVISHSAAAYLHGFDRCARSIDFRRSGVDVTAPTGRSSIAVVNLHASPSIEHDQSVRRGPFEVASVPRTIVDLGTERTVGQLTNCIHEASIDVPEMVDLVAATLAERPNLAQAPCVLDAIANARAGDVGTVSELERLFEEFVGAHRLPEPRRGFTIVTTTIGPVVVDAAWPGARVVVELDGLRLHATTRKRKRDERVRAALEADGFQVRRLGWRDLRDQPRRTAAQLWRLLG